MSYINLERLSEETETSEEELLARLKAQSVTCYVNVSYFRKEWEHVEYDECGSHVTEVMLADHFMPIPTLGSLLNSPKEKLVEHFSPQESALGFRIDFASMAVDLADYPGMTIYIRKEDEEKLLRIVIWRNGTPFARWKEKEYELSPGEAEYLDYIEKHAGITWGEFLKAFGKESLSKTLKPSNRPKDLFRTFEDKHAIDIGELLEIKKGAAQSSDDYRVRIRKT